MAAKPKSKEIIEKGKKIAGNLNGDQALRILYTLVSRDASIASAVGKEADVVISEVDPSGIADRLYDELCSLEIEDCWDASGPQRGGGYSDPIDVAYEMMEEVVRGYTSEMDQCRRLGKHKEELVHLEGIILGLQMFDEDAMTDMHEYLQDDSETFADHLICDWFKQHTEETGHFRELKAFLDEQTPEWIEIYTRERS